MSEDPNTMKQLRILPFFLLAFALSAPLAQAAEPLSREQARSLAVSRSRTLQKALLAVDSARLEEKAQRYSFFPSLSASAGAGLSYPEYSLTRALSASVGLTASQNIYSGGKSRTLAAIDALATQAAREQARYEYFRVLQETDEAYSAVLEAQSAVEAAAGDLEAARTHQSLAQAKLEVGIVTRSEYLKTEAETAAAETVQSQAQGQLAVAQARLASLTGLSLPLTLASTEETVLAELRQRLAGLSAEQTGALIAGVRGAASANNPSLALSDIARRQAGSSLTLARADYLPSVSATWSNSLRSSASQGSGGGSLSLSASIPLDFWVTKASVDAQQVAVRQADLELEETHRTLDLEIQGTVYDLTSSARAVSSSRKALDYAESHYQGILEQYRLSAASSSELSDAQALVSTSRKQLITALAQFRSNLAALRTLAGVESDELLLRIIS